MGELLTADDLAAMLKVERRAVVRTISKLPDFPSTIHLGQRTKRWSRPAVEAWLERRTKA